MGHVLSSDTIYAAAYLTELGRKYLFDPLTNNRFVSDGAGGTIDAFKIVYFSMSDPDYNYNLTPGIVFETGDIANISGKNEDCIKGTIVNEEDNLISVNGQVDGVTGLNPNDNVTVDVPFTLATNIADSTVRINISALPVSTTA
jgi:hypothetical protein